MAARVSVILSVYRAEDTLGGSLAALRQQRFRDFEVIVVDSSPGHECERIVSEELPQARYHHAAKRLSVDAARNVGIEQASGSLLVTIDPDAYAADDWLEKLVEAHQRTGGTVFGAVGCYGKRWLDLAAHLCKFDKWLPGGGLRPVADGPTVNMVISSALLDSLGGKLHDNHGDTELSWRLLEAGHTLWLEPEAVVEHHHRHTLRSLLAERFQRGREYGLLWRQWHPGPPAGLLWRVLITVLPARMLSQLMRVGRNAARSGMLRAYVQTLPVVAAGLYLWLLGEAGTYLKPDWSPALPAGE